MTNNNIFFFFSSRRRHTRCGRDWSSDVCSSDLSPHLHGLLRVPAGRALEREVINEMVRTWNACAQVPPAAWCVAAKITLVEQPANLRAAVAYCLKTYYATGQGARGCDDYVGTFLGTWPRFVESALDDTVLSSGPVAAQPGRPRREREAAHGALLWLRAHGVRSGREIEGYLAVWIQQRRFSRRTFEVAKGEQGVVSVPTYTPRARFQPDRFRWEWPDETSAYQSSWVEEERSSSFAAAG